MSAKTTGTGTLINPDATLNNIRTLVRQIQDTSDVTLQAMLAEALAGHMSVLDQSISDGWCDLPASWRA